jgi:Family of unknown function (DUF5632)
MGQSGSAAAGAVVGQAAAVAIEQQRCDDVVNAVARQEPRLRWAAGTRSDGSTVLVTDLAGGWIPPGIGIPGDVEIPAPGSFTPGRSLQDLLGDNAFESRYAIGEQLGESRVDLSDLPRQVQPSPTLEADVWEAVRGRDGLPWIAHTLAKFGRARPVELDMLREALADHRSNVLASYHAGATDMHAAGNWMLLSVNRRC